VPLNVLLVSCLICRCVQILCFLLNQPRVLFLLRMHWNLKWQQMWMILSSKALWMFFEWQVNLSMLAHVSLWGWLLHQIYEKLRLVSDLSWRITNKVHKLYSDHNVALLYQDVLSVSDFFSARRDIRHICAGLHQTWWKVTRHFGNKLKGASNFSGPYGRILHTKLYIVTKRCK